MANRSHEAKINGKLTNSGKQVVHHLIKLCRFYKWPFHFQELGMDSSFTFLHTRRIKILISVNYILFRPDKKKGNRPLDKPMTPMNSQTSRWKDNFSLISLQFLLFSDLRVNWNVWLKELSYSYLSPGFNNAAHFVAKVSYFIPCWSVFASYKNLIYLYCVVLTPVVPFNALGKFPKAVYGTTGGTCSARFFRPVI